MIYLITGGCGFIGSNMAENLLADGHKVIIIDNLSTGHTKNLEDIPNQHNLSLFKGDLLDKTFLNEVFDNKIDFVYHFSVKR